MTDALTGMTQAKWGALSQEARRRLRSDAGLTKQLIGLEGWRVEVETTEGERRRFIVGRSSGWVPCHIELRKRNSFGGMGADQTYKSVRRLEKVHANSY